MAVIKTSARALLLALLPSAILQGGLISIAALPALNDGGSVAPDLVFGLFTLQVAMFGALLYAGHETLRHVRTCSRGAYAAAGALAAIVSYAITMRYGLYLAAPHAGAVVTAGILPVMAGALGGFLYSQFAGFEHRPLAAGYESDYGSHGLADHRANFKGRFDGPVRVRTSLGAIALAAVLPALLTAIIAFSLFGLGLSDAPYALYVVFPARIFMSALLFTAIPAGIVVLVTHLIARSVGWHNGSSYAAIGAVMSFVIAVCFFPFSRFTALPILALSLTAFGAIMGALYRRFAGLEPLPLPEAVIVSDIETLAPHDDAMRRSHSIVLND